MKDLTTEQKKYFKLKNNYSFNIIKTIRNDKNISFKDIWNYNYSKKDTFILNITYNAKENLIRFLTFIIPLLSVLFTDNPYFILFYFLGDAILGILWILNVRYFHKKTIKNLHK